MRLLRDLGYEDELEDRTSAFPELTAVGGGQREGEKDSQIM